MSKEKKMHGGKVNLGRKLLTDPVKEADWYEVQQIHCSKCFWTHSLNLCFAKSLLKELQKPQFFIVSIV